MVQRQQLIRLRSCGCFPENGPSSQVTLQSPPYSASSPSSGGRGQIFHPTLSHPKHLECPSLKTLFFNIYFIYYLLIWLHQVQLQQEGSLIFLAACGIQFPDQGLNPGPLHWECRVLVTEPAGKSLKHLKARLRKFRPQSKVKIQISKKLLAPCR